MGGRKELYKDLNKYKQNRDRYKKKYYKNGSTNCEKHNWIPEEDKLLFDSILTDRELSKVIHHSVEAIQIRRSRLRKEFEMDILNKLPEIENYISTLSKKENDLRVWHIFIDYKYYNIVKDLVKDYSIQIHNIDTKFFTGENNIICIFYKDFNYLNLIKGDINNGNNIFRLIK